MSLTLRLSFARVVVQGVAPLHRAHVRPRLVRETLNTEVQTPARQIRADGQAKGKKLGDLRENASAGGLKGHSIMSAQLYGFMVHVGKEISLSLSPGHGDVSPSPGLVAHPILLIRNGE